MAQQHRQGRPRNEIGFREIELLKEETLGVGSYGSVYKARCDHLLCAAKIIHPTLVLPNALQQISPQKEHRLPIRRFEMECNFLKEIRHPNIIQYLGMYRHPETDLPVLLMELMDESLTHFLETSTEPIPYHIQLTICLDIVQALSFLHLNGIIHRDLSSNNILLIGKGRAKLTDFGMAKLVHLSGVSNTMCPGTNAYMPPEAVREQAVFTEKGDVFSFGVNIIQLLTRKFPKPGDRFKTVASSDPQFPSGKVEVRVSEIERRNNHISEINPAHPLLPIALDCLKDQEGERPSTSELCQRLATSKDTSEYTESERAVENKETILLQAITDKDIQLSDKMKENKLLQNERDQLIKAKERQEQAFEQLQKENEQTQEFILARQQENQDLREELSTAQATISEKEYIIITRDQQQRDHEEMIAQFQRRIEELELNSRPQPRAQSLSSSDIARATLPKQPSRGHQPTQHPSSTSSTRVKAPCIMFRSSDAVVDGGVAYFRPDDTAKIYEYDSTTYTWSHLPDCPPEHSALTIVDGLLTTVGGDNTNKLFSLTGEGRGRKWEELLPPMTTKRSQAVVMATEDAIVVAGGMDETRRCLKTVEIKSNDTRQWSAAADLPQPIRRASATICGDNAYVLGAIDDYPNAVKTVYTCSLAALLETSHSDDLLDSLASTVSQFIKGSPWSTIANLPVAHSTCVTFNDQVLAIGGTDAHGDPTTAVHTYDPVKNSWEVISHLLTPRRLCFAVVLPDDRVMAVGGYTSQSWDSRTDSVEFINVA